MIIIIIIIIIIMIVIIIVIIIIIIIIIMTDRLAVPSPSRRAPLAGRRTRSAASCSGRSPACRWPGAPPEQSSGGATCLTLLV